MSLKIIGGGNMSETSEKKHTNPVYKKLAQLLDTIPNGFPATKSGVELKLLAKLFSPEEAELALHLKLTPQSAELVARSAGGDPQALEGNLKRMVGKGLIRMKRGEKGPVFGLMPFVVGIYEMQIGRMDEEMARLFEDYYKEAYHKVMTAKPAIHRVIPVEQAVQVGVSVLPYERASDILSQAQSWGVLDCICRTQQKLIGKGCEHPINICMVFSKKPNAYDKAKVIRPLTKEEALEMLRRAEEAGLVHTAGNHLDDIDYICNCCSCGCAILRGAAEFGILSIVEPSAFQISVNEDSCVGCELCIDRCQFKALSMADGICKVDLQRCFGCGICVPSCADGALNLVPRQPDQVKSPPGSLADWMMERAAVRGLDPEKLEQILGKIK
jgi:electron transport complex protein RnfB